jgi:outer membrane protein OmpA-like peptidoglycan-associated protein
MRTQRVRKGVIRAVLLLAAAGVVNVAYSQRGDIDVGVRTAQSSHPVVRSQLVRANVLRVQVRDELNQQIPGLQAENFQLVRRGLRAEVIKCSPITQLKELSQRVVLLIDNSSSMGEHLDKLLMDLDTLLASFGRSTLVGVALFGPKDSRMTSNFGRDLPLKVRWFTANKSSIVRYLHSELTLPQLAPDTHLYDEIWAGFRMLEASRAMRKNDAAIVLSDGDDNASSVGLADVTSLRWETTPVYAIDYMTSSSNGHLLELAEKTHGKYFRTTDIGTLKQIFAEIATALTLGGYELEFRFRDPARAIQPRFCVPLEMMDSTSAQSTVDTLIVEEQIVQQRFPLLSYIFFDPGSSSIATRYRQLPSKDDAALFDETRVSGNALDHYYQVLNIIGSRMRKHPAGQIVITGCSDNGPYDAGVQDIGRRRAEAVQQYLKDVWGIEERRLLVASRGLPDVPSTNSLEEGRMENRRVEIESRDWDIISPVTFEMREVTAKPPETVFKMEISAVNGLREWTMPLYAGSSVFHELKGTSAGLVDLHWNWKNAAGQLPRSSLRYEIIVEDSSNQKTAVPGSAIPVRYLSTERKHMEQLPEKDVERISLILFEFGKADLGPTNDRILQSLPERISPLSNVTVIGYTDMIGEEETNRILSHRRSQAVRDKLMALQRSGRPMSVIGLGELYPLFTNELPEGRFYNRTVQIIIETPRAPQ